MTRTKLRQYQRLLAPGTALRSGLDRILHGGTGAIVVLGHNQQVRRILSGGFQLNVEFTPQALRELAKMDGAIVLSSDLSRIVAAGVQLVPPGDLPTAETGTRHRSADRTAQATSVPCVTVSASMSIISLFQSGHRHLIETTGQMISRANQTLATLSSFVSRLEDILAQFNMLEVADQVTIRSLILLAQRHEMTRRLSDEMQFHIDTLGVEGRLIALQHSELAATFETLEPLLVQDYAHNVSDPANFSFSQLENFSAEELLSPMLVAEHMGFGSNTFLETQVSPRGYRLLVDVGHLPVSLVDRLLEQFTLQELFGASLTELMQLDGIGKARGRLIRDALLRITEAAYSRPDKEF